MTSSPVGNPPPPRLEAHSVGKTYGAFRALRDVTFDIVPGELHGLVGQNGSGKSTLIKIFTGYHAPDAGAVVHVDGRPVAMPLNANERRKHGISVVHQSLGLVADRTVTENVRVEHHAARRWTRRISWAVEREHTAAALARLGSSVDPNARVSELSAEDQATVAIARAMQNYEPGTGLIVFDESTRPLTKDALDRFYDVLSPILQSGTSVLMISHRLEEVMQHTDRVSILRDGTLVEAGLKTAEITENQIISSMLGRNIQRAQRPAARTANGARHLASAPQGAVRSTELGSEVTVSSLTGSVVGDLAFTIAPGEVLGITGLVGSGFEEVPYLLAGASQARSGTLRAGGETVDLIDARVESMIDRGVALVPEDRAALGLCLDMSIEQNITVPRLRTKGRPAWTGRGWREQELAEMISALDIRPPEGAAPVGTLSGGNQQKVLLAKWLVAKPHLLLLHEPTQAVDVGAREDIVRAVFDLATTGAAVLVAASDPAELAVLCSRVLVLHEGQLVEELTGEFDQDQIVHATFAEARVARSTRRAANGR